MTEPPDATDDFPEPIATPKGTRYLCSICENHYEWASIAAICRETHVQD